MLRSGERKIVQPMELTNLLKFENEEKLEIRETPFFSQLAFMQIHVGRKKLRDRIWEGIGPTWD